MYCPKRPRDTKKCLSKSPCQSNKQAFQLEISLEAMYTVASAPGSCRSSPHIDTTFAERLVVGTRTNSIYRFIGARSLMVARPLSVSAYGSEGRGGHSKSRWNAVLESSPRTVDLLLAGSPAAKTGGCLEVAGLEKLLIYRLLTKASRYPLLSPAVTKFVASE